MKTYFLLLFSLFCIGNAQTQISTLIIDRSEVDVSDDISFPLWLGQGQTVKPGRTIELVSLLEFNASDGLAFNKVISLKTTDTVPSGKVWKIESVVKKSDPMSLVATKPSAIGTSPITLSTDKEFFVVPPGVHQIAIEMWGMGGRAGNCITNGSYGQGGSSGGYGYQVVNVSPMDTLFYNIGYANNGNLSDTTFININGLILFATPGKNGVNSNQSYIVPLPGGTTNLAYTESGNSPTTAGGRYQGYGAPYGGGNITSCGSSGSCSGTIPGGGGMSSSSTSYGGGSGGMGRIKIHY